MSHARFLRFVTIHIMKIVCHRESWRTDTKLHPERGGGVVKVGTIHDLLFRVASSTCLYDALCAVRFESYLSSALHEACPENLATSRSRIPAILLGTYSYLEFVLPCCSVLSFNRVVYLSNSLLTIFFLYSTNRSHI